MEQFIRLFVTEPRVERLRAVSCVPRAGCRPPSPPWPSLGCLPPPVPPERGFQLAGGATWA
eukprot:94687-Alexandrium_andersonii.AAC.1